MQFLRSHILTLATLPLLSPALGVSDSRPQTGTRMLTLRLEREAEVDPVEAPGISFPPIGAARLLLDGGQSALWLPGDASGSGRQRIGLPDPRLLTAIPRADGSVRIWYLDPDRRELRRLDVDGRGSLLGSARDPLAAELTGAVGLAADPARREICVLDADSRAVLRFELDARGRPVSKVGALPLPKGLGEVAGLALDAASGRFVVLSAKGRSAYTLDRSGRLLSVTPLAESSGRASAIPAAVAFGASSDATDEPGASSLYLAATPGAEGDPGRVLEWTYRTPPASAAPLASQPGIAVRSFRIGSEAR